MLAALRRPEEVREVLEGAARMGMLLRDVLELLAETGAARSGGGGLRKSVDAAVDDSGKASYWLG